MNKFKKFLAKILPFLLTIGALVYLLIPYKNPAKVTYNEFLSMLEEGKVEKVSINFSAAKFEFADKDGTTYETDNPKIENFKEMLLKKDIEVNEIGTSIFRSLLSVFLNIVIYFVLFFILVKKVTPQTNTAEIVTTVPKIKFDDIAGHKELKNDLEFVVKYLKDPEKYKRLGARIPKGIILYGPPGTGKTLTAKAIAGTAGVPFFSMSGSDFVEMYVGLGAKRVRELYKKAKQSAPCIVFIDEIDAIGGRRDAADTHSENRQTINALLSELDGFNGAEGVLTICATNKLEMLDPALIRPGRFDKQLAVPLPEKEDRLELLKIHSKGKVFSPEIRWKDIAAMTIGFSGAAIEAMLNEAAFIAANNDEPEITYEDIDRAFYKMLMKGDKKDNKTRDKKELEIVAWHEAGHALLTKLLTKDSVPKVTIVASTSGAGGVTIRTPQDKNLYSKKYLKSLIKVMYAGRIAEQLLLKDDNEVTTGAENDIKQATELIKDYVTSYGMDEDIGPINLSTLKIFDDKVLVSKMTELSKCLYEEAKELLIKNCDKLKKIADELLEKETITESELNELIGLAQ